MYSEATAFTLFSTYANGQLRPEDYLKKFHFLLKHSSDQIINFLKDIPDRLMLIQLSLTDEALSHWCKDTRMTDFWDDTWWHCDENPSFHEAENDTSLRYRGKPPQQYISSYQLLCGWYLYTEAELLVKKGRERDSEQVLALLMQAAGLNYFEALQTLSDIYCDKLGDDLIEFPEQIFAPFVTSAVNHGTPGYLLCALNYYYIAEYYSRKQKIGDSQQAYMHALTFLYAAQHCEPASEHEIYNAYCGQGIKESNFWKIDNIAQLINVLFMHSHLDINARDKAYHAGNNIGQDFIGQRKECKERLTPHA